MMFQGLVHEVRDDAAATRRAIEVPEAATRAPGVDPGIGMAGVQHNFTLFTTQPVSCTVFCEIHRAFLIMF